MAQAGPSQPPTTFSSESEEEGEGPQALPGSGWGSGAREKYLMKPFEISIRSKNQDPTTHRQYHCELNIPARWARANGFTKDTEHVMFTSKAMADAPPPDGAWMLQRFRKPAPEASRHFWLIRYGWKEFSEKHGIRKGWKLLFTPDPALGAQYLHVQRKIPTGRPGTETVVDLEYYTSSDSSD